MLVFLDANVILIGSLDPTSAAGRLTAALGKHSFRTTDGVIAEVEHQIRTNAEGKNAASAIQRLHRFLRSVRIVVIPSIQGRGMGDADWSKFAEENGCSSICTYNLKDFPNSRSITPEALVRSGTVTDLVAYPRLSEEGTLFFGFRTHHPLRDFVLLQGGGGSAIINEKGEIHAVGNGSTTRVRSAIRVGHHANFVFRYRCGGRFEGIDYVEGPDGYFTGRILSTGRFGIMTPIQARLVFAPGHRFAGEITFIDGYPAYLGDRRASYVWKNQSTALLDASVSTSQLLQIWSNWDILGVW